MLARSYDRTCRKFDTQVVNDLLKQLFGRIYHF